jgi:hypothetical protein
MLVTMSRLSKLLQFLGPLALFVTTSSAELAAVALNHFPASESLWYLNLAVFRVFWRSYVALTQYVDLASFQLFGIALPIFGLACIGLTVRSKLPLAVSTQLAVGYAVFMLLSWPTGSSTAQASLRVVALPTGEGSYMLTGILGLTVLSCIITHLLYLRKSRPR